MLTRDYAQIKSNPAFMKAKWGTTLPEINASPLVLNQALLELIPKELLKALEGVEIKVNEKKLTALTALGIASTANNDNLVLTAQECSALNVFIITQYLMNFVWFSSLNQPLQRSLISVKVTRDTGNLVVAYSQKEKSIADYTEMFGQRTIYKIKCSGILNPNSTFSYKENIENIFIAPYFLRNKLLLAASTYLNEHSSLTENDLYPLIPLLMDEKFQELFNAALLTSANDIKQKAAELINLYFADDEARQKIVVKLSNLTPVVNTELAGEKLDNDLSLPLSGSKTTELQEETTTAPLSDRSLDPSTQPPSTLVASQPHGLFTADELKITDSEAVSVVEQQEVETSTHEHDLQSDTPTPPVPNPSTTPLPASSSTVAEDDLQQAAEISDDEHSRSSTVNSTVLKTIAAEQNWPVAQTSPLSSPHSTPLLAATSTLFSGDGLNLLDSQGDQIEVSAELITNQAPPETKTKTDTAATIVTEEKTEEKEGVLPFPFQDASLEIPSQLPSSLKNMTPPAADEIEDTAPVISDYVKTLIITPPTQDELGETTQVTSTHTDETLKLIQPSGSPTPDNTPETSRADHKSSLSVVPELHLDSTAASRSSSVGSLEDAGDLESEETEQHSISHPSAQPPTTVNDSPSLSLTTSSAPVTDLSLTTEEEEFKSVTSSEKGKIKEETQTPSQFQLEEEQAGMTIQQIFTLNRNNLNKITAATTFDAAQIESSKKLAAAIDALTPAQLDQSQLLLIEVMRCANTATVDPSNATNLATAQQLAAPLNRARLCKIALALTAIITGAAILLLATAVTAASFMGGTLLGLEVGTSLLSKAVYIGCGLIGLNMTLIGARLFSQNPLKPILEASTEITQNARMKIM